jgi:hypothetical protein
MVSAEMGMKCTSSFSLHQTHKSEELASKPNIEFSPEMDGVINL